MCQIFLLDILQCDLWYAEIFYINNAFWNCYWFYPQSISFYFFIFILLYIHLIMKTN